LRPTVRRPPAARRPSLPGAHAPAVLRPILPRRPVAPRRSLPGGQVAIGGTAVGRRTEGRRGRVVAARAVSRQGLVAGRVSVAVWLAVTSPSRVAPCRAVGRRRSVSRWARTGPGHARTSAARRTGAGPGASGRHR